MSIILFITSIILDYAIDAFLVGSVFHFMKNKFGWKFTPKKDFLILFIVFLLLDNYLWPAFYILDVTYTIHNAAVAKFFEFSPNEPLSELFGFGMFEFIIWSVQALIANYIGLKMINPKLKESI